MSKNQGKLPALLCRFGCIHFFLRATKRCVRSISIRFDSVDVDGCVQFAVGRLCARNRFERMLSFLFSFDRFVNVDYNHIKCINVVGVSIGVAFGPNWRRFRVVLCRFKLVNNLCTYFGFSRLVFIVYLHFVFCCLSFYLFVCLFVWWFRSCFVFRPPQYWKVRDLLIAGKIERREICFVLFESLLCRCFSCMVCVVIVVL